MPKNSGPIIAEEKRLIEVMIRVYYQKNDGDIPQAKMLNYALRRLDYCRFGEEKTTCQKCPVHCYQKEYRQQMKKIMRYSGPRMLFYHPVLCIRHALRGRKKKEAV